MEKKKVEKPFHKKWWFWVFIIYMVSLMTMATVESNNYPGLFKINSKSVETQSVNSEKSIIVYYVTGSNVYHLSKSDPTLRRSKYIHEMTLKEAKANGMHQSASKADN